MDSPSGSNPYESPLAPLGLPGVWPGEHRPLRVGLTLVAATRVYLANFWACVGIMLLTVLTGMAIYLMIGMVIFAFAGKVDLASDSRWSQLGVAAITLVPRAFVQAYLFAGQAHYFLKVARGDRDALFRRLFDGDTWFWRFLGVLLLAVGSVLLGGTLVVGVFWLIGKSGASFDVARGGMIAAGTLMAGLGVFAGLAVAMSPLLIVDRDLGLLASLSESLRLTSGNRGKLLLTLGFPAVVGALVYIVPALTMPPSDDDASTAATVASLTALGIAFFAVLPWLYMTWAVSYLMMSGQPIAAEGGYNSKPPEHAMPEPTGETADRPR